MFTGVSGSGKSSLAFGTLYAEAQRRYLESVAPYARRLIQQVGAPQVESITGLPPAVALQQRRGAGERPVHRRHGDHAVELAADAVLPRRHLPARRAAAGLRRLLPQHRRRRLPGVPRARAGAPGHRGVDGPGPLAQHPRAGDRLVARCLAGQEPARHPGHPRPRHRPPVARARPGRPRLDPLHRRGAGGAPSTPSARPGRIQRPYQGKYRSARRHVLHTLSDSRSATMRQRMLQFVQTVPCPVCDGHRPAPEALAVTFAGTTSPTSPAAAGRPAPQRAAADALAPGRAPSEDRRGDGGRDHHRRPGRADRGAARARAGLPQP